MAKSKSSSTKNKDAGKVAKTRLPLAVQVYTLRSLPVEPEAVLAAVADAGYSGIEMAGTLKVEAEELRDLLDK
ncbi:MAG: hypothetical protein KDD75_00985, partial [Caldilineaceae bacterium]|nr:hypothetical protein [Caldilineaceae bacterium]